MLRNRPLWARSAIPLGRVFIRGGRVLRIVDQSGTADLTASSAGHDRSTLNSILDDRDEYFDNLVLADRAFEELPRAMQRASVWEQTTVLISSDHGWRNDVRGELTDVVHTALPRKPLPLVPFLLKLPGHDQPLDYSASLNTILTHDLILELIRGELSTPRRVVSWLDYN